MDARLLGALLLLVLRAARLAPRVVLVGVAVVGVELVQHLGHVAQPAGAFALLTHICWESTFGRTPKDIQLLERLLRQS